MADQQPTEPTSSPSTNDPTFDLAEELKQAFAVLGPADIPVEDKQRWQQRLIAITNSSKHDVATAAGRMERYWQEWEDTVGPRTPASPPA